MNIDAAINDLKVIFNGNSEMMAANILQDNSCLPNAIELSHQADVMDYHSPDLTGLRISLIDVLLGLIKDNSTAKNIITHLQRDFANNIPLSSNDAMLYNINMSLLSATFEPNFPQAIAYAQLAYNLVATHKARYEDKIRIIANMIQYLYLNGNMPACAKWISLGERNIKLSKSVAYNALFIFAKTLPLMDQGKFQEVIDLINQHQDLLTQQKFYPPMRFFPLMQLAEALIKMGDVAGATNILTTLEQQGNEFYGTDAKNNFFGKLFVLQAMCLNGDLAENLLHKGLEVYEHFFQAKDQHRAQAFAHLQLGKFYQRHEQLQKAKLHYLHSEAIFNKLLKGYTPYDVSDLHKQLTFFTKA